MGYVATPDCFNTFGLLGALSSFSIVHFGLPVPVLVAVQPAGALPTAALSKFTVSPCAATANAVMMNTVLPNLFMEYLRHLFTFA
jgi:hypothetical protein